MRYPFRADRGHARVALLILLAVFAAPGIAGEIFKCVAKDGTPLYQNFPCNIDSMGFAPSEPTAGKPGQDKAKAASVAAVSAKAGEVRVGMSIDEVRALMGEPEEMIEDEPGVGGRVMNWRYADGRTVQFDHKHRVLGVLR
jgi:Domain of unknown function (DUF4124)